jgi:hypothetical protein
MNIKVQVDAYSPAVFEIDERERITLLDNSVKRLINSAMEVADRYSNNDSLAEQVGEDLRSLKRIMKRLWYSAQQAVIACEIDLR